MIKYQTYNILIEMETCMGKLVGVIGGMGPVATQLFYKMITDMTLAQCDQEHLNLIIYSDASIPDRTTAILNGDYNHIYAQLLADAKMLEGNGCAAICIPCNTAHFFADMIQSELRIPIIHMIKETSEKVAKEAGDGKVAILGTDGTIKTELYQHQLKQVGVEGFILPKDMQEIVMYEIYDRVKKGKPGDERQWDILDGFLNKSGCKNAILACTELSVIKEELFLSDFYIDPMQILARAAIEFSGKSIIEKALERVNEKDSFNI